MMATLDQLGELAARIVKLEATREKLRLPRLQRRQLPEVRDRDEQQLGWVWTLKPSDGRALLAGTTPSRDRSVVSKSSVGGGWSTRR